MSALFGAGWVATTDCTHRRYQGGLINKLFGSTLDRVLPLARKCSRDRRL